MTTGSEAGRTGTAVYGGRVLPEWIDINAHMNVAYYVLAFDLAVDRLWERFGMTGEHVRANSSSTCWSNRTRHSIRRSPWSAT